jgi:tetratricopeptide (TPR) repeat protein
MPARQRSLRSTIEWSQGLLDESHQRLLRRLGVFVDGWSVEAAEAVGGDDAVDIFLGLEALVAQSMVAVEPDGRMSMGSAMREFAGERLTAEGDEEVTRHRHADYYLGVSESVEPLLRGVRQREMVISLSPDWRNFRSAAEWALSRGHHEMAGSLYANLWVLVWQGDHWFEAESYTRRFVEIADRLNEDLRARVLFVAAGTYMEMGDSKKAIEFARPAAELASRLGEHSTEAWARMMITGALLALDVYDPEARGQLATAIEMARAGDERFALGYALSFRATVLTVDGDPEAAMNDHHEALEIARSLDNVSMLTQVWSQTAFTHLSRGDVRAARTCLEQGAEVLDRVRTLEVLAIFLDAVASLAFAEGEPVRAITALGAANHARSRAGLARWAILETLLEGAGMAAEQEQPSLAEARRAGSEMTPHDAISFALQPHHELATAG